MHTTKPQISLPREFTIFQGPDMPAKHKLHRRHLLQAFSEAYRPQSLNHTKHDLQFHGFLLSAKTAEMMRTTGLAIRLRFLWGGCAPGRLPASAEVFPFREGKKQGQKRTERKSL
jgi:hypothetical protein